MVVDGLAHICNHRDGVARSLYIRSAQRNDDNVWFLKCPRFLLTRELAKSCFCSAPYSVITEPCDTQKTLWYNPSVHSNKRAQTQFLNVTYTLD